MFYVAKRLAQVLSGQFCLKQNFSAQQWFDWAIEQGRKPAFNPKVEVFSPFRNPFSDNSPKAISAEAEKAAVCCACTACTACGGNLYGHDDNKASSDAEKLRVEAEKKKKEEEQKEHEVLLHAAKQKSENSDLDQMKKDNTYWEQIAKFLATELEKRKIIEATKELSAEDWMRKAIESVDSVKEPSVKISQEIKESNYNSVPWTETKPTIPGIYRAETPKGDIRLAHVYLKDGRLVFRFQDEDTRLSYAYWVPSSSFLVKRWAGPYGEEFEDAKDFMR